MKIKNIFFRIWQDVRKSWWLLALLGAYFLVSPTFFPTSCLAYSFFGLPCPGCGMTRALYFTLTGQFARAYFINPLIFLILGFTLYCLVFRYILGKKVPGFFLGIILLALTIIVFYIVRMYLYFPTRVPYVYNFQNTMESLVPGYRDFIRNLFNF